VAGKFCCGYTPINYLAVSLADLCHPEHGTFPCQFVYHCGFDAGGGKKV
jgi:hypothetical protein